MPIIHSMIIKLEDEDETLSDPYLEFSEKKTKREGKKLIRLTVPLTDFGVDELGVTDVIYGMQDT